MRGNRSNPASSRRRSSGASRADAGDNVVAYPGRKLLFLPGKKKESRYRSRKSSLRRRRSSPSTIRGDFRQRLFCCWCWRCWVLDWSCCFGQAMPAPTTLSGSSFHDRFRPPDFAGRSSASPGRSLASFVNYHWLRKFVWPLYAASLGLCMRRHPFEAEGGARRWVIFSRRQPPVSGIANLR